MKIAFAVALHHGDYKNTLLAKSLQDLYMHFDWTWTINNEDGLGTVYNRAIQETDADFLVLCHGDVFIQHPELLEAQLIEAHKQFDIVGLAGCCEVQTMLPGAWHRMGSRLSGRVSHTKDNKTWLSTYGPTPSEVELLDGLFLSLKMSAIGGLRFDEQFKFDHYDLDFCLTARKHNLKIGTWPIDVIHAGLGDRVQGDASWKESNARFQAKWGGGNGAKSGPESHLLRISYMAHDKGGCDYYRAMMPLDMLHEQKLADVMRLDRGDNSERVTHALANSEVIVFPRMAMDLKMLELIRELKSYGKLIVTDYDDWIWAVNPLSNHYLHYGVEEYQYPLHGELIDVWKDGVKGFSIEANRKQLNAAKMAIEMSDLVTTTTEILAEKIRKFNPNVAVLPNCVDFERWKPIQLLKNRKAVRIFWAGGSSHFEDLQIIEPVMQAVMQRFPEVTFVLMGMKFEAFLRHLPQERIEFHLWEDNLSYPYKCAMLGADIALVPLVDNEFNRSKSAIKWIEQSALGVPSVVSWVTPYKEWYTGLNAVMVEDNSTDAWIEAISWLVRDPVVRAKIGGEAQRFVRANFDIRRRAKDWLAVYAAHVKEPLIPRELEIEVTPCP